MTIHKCQCQEDHKMVTPWQNHWEICHLKPIITTLILYYWAFWLQFWGSILLKVFLYIKTNYHSNLPTKNILHVLTSSSLLLGLPFKSVWLWMSFYKTIKLNVHGDTFYNKSISNSDFHRKQKFPNMNDIYQCVKL